MLSESDVQGVFVLPQNFILSNNHLLSHHFISNTAVNTRQQNTVDEISNVVRLWSSFDVQLSQMNKKYCVGYVLKKIKTSINQP